MYKKLSLLIASSLLLSLPARAATPSETAGLIKIDGSSTVYPITEAVAEDFGHKHSNIKVTVGIAGTGGGFKRFCAGEIDISNASRPIKTTEVELCASKNIKYVELPVAYDALTIVVNPKNTWANEVTVAELKKIWEPEAQGKVTTWKQVRPSWPDRPIKLYGPGVDSGTYDYFTEVIVGKEHSSRGDFTSSEDDNMLVQGIASDENALGFFGMAYYENNMNKLKALPVDDGKAENGNGPQSPTAANVENNRYAPLSRPLFIYVSKASMDRPEIKSFISFYLNSASTLANEVGYVSLNSNIYNLASARFDKGSLGSIYTGASQVGATLEQLLKSNS